MNQNLSALLSALFTSLFSCVMAQSPARMPDKRIKILLIGTWHFAVNSTNDANRYNLIDLTSPKRQGVIRPRKFFVESVPARQATMVRLCTLFVAAYQTSVMRQQSAAVWPKPIINNPRLAGSYESSYGEQWQVQYPNRKANEKL